MGSRMRQETHLSPEVIRRLSNIESVSNALSVGSKRRLLMYCRDLSLSEGHDKDFFDSKLYEAILPYLTDEARMIAEKCYLDSIKDDDGFKFSRNLKIYSKTEAAFLEFSKPDHSNFTWNINYQKARKELKDLILQGGQLTPLTFLCDDDIKENLPKTGTHSGFYYIESGKVKKGDNIEGLYEAFLKGASTGLTNGDLDRPVLIGFRTQASGEYEDDGTRTNTCKHKLRVVCMVDLIQIVCELMFSRPVQDRLSKMEFYGGGKNDEWFRYFVSDCRSKFPKFISIDYSSFDQTISSWLIKDSFAILKECFSLDEEQSKLFDLVEHDFIHKDLILNEGVLHLHKGVPSGSMFTQIIDSMVNFLAISTYFNHLGKRRRMNIMGDDNLIFCDADVEMADIASYIRKNFGLIIKVDDKSNEGDTQRSHPKYLSRYWRFDGPWRHPYLIWSRMLFPERFRQYSEQVTPYHVILAYILTYSAGAREFINVEKFRAEHPISLKELDIVDSRYIPGVAAYLREYGNRYAA